MFNRVVEIEYPSSVNRGYFSYIEHNLSNTAWIRSVSILCQSRLFLLPLTTLDDDFSRKWGIHPLSIEAISPTLQANSGRRSESKEYPSSVNRGYFSYRQLLPADG